MADSRPTEILLTEQQIYQRVRELAGEIRRDFPDDLHLVAVLKGAFIFLSDLVRHMSGHISLDFMALSSYATGTTRSGEVRLLKDLDTTLDGKNVVVIEDIVDTGFTLKYLLRTLGGRNPKSLAVCTLLDRKARRIIDMDLQYVGFEIPDKFVVGYGLDYRQHYRNLPYIGVLKL